MHNIYGFFLDLSIFCFYLLLNIQFLTPYGLTNNPLIRLNPQYIIYLLLYKSILFLKLLLFLHFYILYHQVMLQENYI